MNGRLSKLTYYSRTGLFPLIICAVFFLSGIIFGTVLSFTVKEDDPVYDSIRSFIDGVSENGAEAAGFLESFFDNAKYPAAVFAFGFSLPGVILIPLFSAFRGFIFSFSVALVTKTAGADAFSLIITVFWTEILVSLPCFLVLAGRSLEASAALVKAVVWRDVSELTYNKKFYLRYAVCMMILAAATLAQRAVITMVLPSAGAGIIR